MVFYTVTVYKIRVDGNASLVKEDWNTWSPSRRFTNKDRNLPKQRNDLRCNIASNVIDIQLFVNTVLHLCSCLRKTL